MLRQLYRSCSTSACCLMSRCVGGACPPGGPCWVERIVGAHSETAGMGDAVVTVLDRFLAAGISREAFDAHLAAGRVAVAGERITDPAHPRAAADRYRDHA